MLPAEIARGDEARIHEMNLCRPDDIDLEKVENEPQD